MYSENSAPDFGIDVLFAFFNRDIIALNFCLLYLCISTFFHSIDHITCPKNEILWPHYLSQNGLLLPHYLSHKWDIMTTLHVPIMGYCYHITCPKNGPFWPHYLSQKWAVVTTLPVPKMGHWLTVWIWDNLIRSCTIWLNKSNFQ